MVSSKASSKEKLGFQFRVCSSNLISGTNSRGSLEEVGSLPNYSKLCLFEGKKPNFLANSFKENFDSRANIKST